MCIFTSGTLIGAPPTNGLIVGNEPEAAALVVGPEGAAADVVTTGTAEVAGTLFAALVCVGAFPVAIWIVVFWELTAANPQSRNVMTFIILLLGEFRNFEVMDQNKFLVRYDEFLKMKILIRLSYYLLMIGHF